MWLLDTTTFELKAFHSSAGVKYAILSHTWGGDDDEVTFYDMAHRPRYQEKPGWQKIEKTCELARRMQLQYAWIDTCCIDKTSSAELSEAINSMFSWYRDSWICFVYLSTYVDESPMAPPIRNASMAQELARYKWFQRGWTLQELIAPSKVTFLDRSWEPIGTKKTLCDTLAEVTGIDSVVLRSVEALSTIHVGRKFSWAAHRSTKRVEDLAYCLLGIFDVNMPLLYGEGPKAFIRLQEEIIRSTNDLTLFAWQQDTSSSGQNGQLRAILAHSPSEFRYCGKLLTLEEKLDVETEFTLTNRGLRFDRHLGVANTKPSDLLSDNDLVLGLDCLERSERTENVPRWVGIYLRKIGSTYVRVMPDNLHYSTSRVSRLNLAMKQVAYTATSLSDLDMEVIHENRTVGIFYHSTLHAVIPYDFRANLSGSRISYGSMYYIDSFASRGLRSCMFLHLFMIKVGKPLQEYRFALVCGLQGRTKFERIEQSPWAHLCAEAEFSHLPNHPICKLGAFKQATNEDNGMTFEERTGIFRDYIFENYLDSTGQLSQNSMCKSLSIEDHEISVRVDHASEHSWSESSSRYTYIIRLSYSKCLKKT
jgi:hypothetical protein